MRKEVISEAHQLAGSVLRRFGVTGPKHIEVERWLRSYGVELFEAPLDGASAQLVRLNGRVQITLSERVSERGAQRFSLAHEMFHFIKRHPSLSPAMVCTPGAVRGVSPEMRTYEIGANAFAGEILLPEFLLRQRCEGSTVSLDTPHAIAKDFDVSILAATIKFVELSTERCAAVFTQQGKVKWSARSPSFTTWISKGKAVSRESLAFDFFAHGKIDERSQAVPARAWIDSAADVEIVEHAICSCEHGTVLSLLWAPESVAPQLGMI